VLRDGFAGVLLFVLSLLPLGVRGLELGELHHSVPVWLTVALAFGQSLGLALRRFRPAVALLLVGLSFAAAQLSGADTGLAGIGLLIAIYSFAAYQRVRRRGYGALAIAGYVALATALHFAGSPAPLLDWVTFFVVLTTPFLVGLLVRRRVAEQSARETLAAELAVQTAKRELARDLHDIVTHHVTAIVVQADSSAYIGPDDSAERAVMLQSISSTGRRALQELRSLLGALEYTAVGTTPADQQRGPAPTDVSALVDEICATGYPISLTQNDLPDFSRAVSVTLYRVAQEATTNAMKHAPGEPIAIGLKRAEDRVELTIENRAVSKDAGLPGRGRRGMADRVALLGGTIDIGVVNGCFRVRVSVDPQAQL
jgi:signal transduction histidine kinase